MTQTPRDLFNPPPQAGEVLDANGRHVPTHFVYDIFHGIEPRPFKPFDPRMDVAQSYSPRAWKELEDHVKSFVSMSRLSL